MFFRGREIHVLWKSKKNTIGSNSSIFLEGGPSESSFPLSAAPGEKTIRGSKRFLTRAAVWLDDEDSGCNVYDYTYTYLHIYISTCVYTNTYDHLLYSFINWEFQDQWMILVGLLVIEVTEIPILPVYPPGFLGNISHLKKGRMFFSKKQISIDEKNLPDVTFSKNPFRKMREWDGIKIHKNPYPNGFRPWNGRIAIYKPPLLRQKICQNAARPRRSCRQRAEYLYLSSGWIHHPHEQKM